MASLESFTLSAVLLDTSVLINLLRKSSRHMKLIDELLQNRFTLVTSSVNVAELYAGLREGEEQVTEDLLAGMLQLPLTPKIAQMAGEMTAARRRIGRTHELDDMMVAATAIEHAYPLFTDNRKDFLIPGLVLWPPI